MGGGGSNTQTQTSEPWAGQQPFLADIYSQAQQQHQQGPQQYFPGSTVAPFSDQSQQGLDALFQRGAQGAPHEQALQQYLMQQMGQPGINLDPAVGGANQLMGGIGTSQQMLGQFAQNPFQASAFGMPGASGFEDVLRGGYGGLGEAQQFAGSSSPGALGASVNYVNNLLGDQGSALPGVAQQQLSQTAGGDFLGSNPHLDSMFGNAADRVSEQFNKSVMPGINATFGGAGRTGSGIHGETVSGAAGELGRNLSGLASSIYAPAYESERNRQMQAAGQLGGFGLNEAQQRLQAAGLGGDLFSAQNAADLSRLGLASNLYLGERGLAQQGAGMGLGFMDQGLDRSMGAAGMLGQQGLGGIGALGGLYGQQGAQQLGAAGMVPGVSGLDYNNIGAMMGAGGAHDAMAQNQLSDDVNRWNFGQQAPMQNLQNYANLIYGGPSFGTTTTTEQLRTNPLAGAVGGAMAGSMFGPWGMLGGGVLGGLGSWG